MLPLHLIQLPSEHTIEIGNNRCMISTMDTQVTIPATTSTNDKPVKPVLKWRHQLHPAKQQSHRDHRKYYPFGATFYLSCLRPYVRC
jgi:hypothetical protein